MTKMERLEKLYAEIKEELCSIGLEVPEDVTLAISGPKRTKTLGRANRATMTITISLFMFDYIDLHLKQTLVHEVLHLLPGGNSHTGPWKAYAKKVNTHFPHYAVSRCADLQSFTFLEGLAKEYRMPQSKYTITCRSCGSTTRRSRMSQDLKIGFAQNVVVCTKCNGRKFDVIQHF